MVHLWHFVGAMSILQNFEIIIHIQFCAGIKAAMPQCDATVAH